MRCILDNTNECIMKNLHFIRAQCHQSDREQGYQFAPDEIKQGLVTFFSSLDSSPSLNTFQVSHKVADGLEQGNELG